MERSHAMSMRTVMCMHIEKEKIIWNEYNSSNSSSTLMNILRNQHKEPDFSSVLNIINILDFEGQPEVIHLLSALNLHPTVSFLVHDLSNNLDDQVLVKYSGHGEHVFEPYHLIHSNFDTIKFLMSTFNDSLRKPARQVPQLIKHFGHDEKSYICCVGTRADKVTTDVIQNVDKRLTAMVEELGCKAGVWQSEGGGVLFPVDNTTAGDVFIEDETAKYIRSKIEKIASDKDFYEVPITWMLFELEIRQVCSIRSEAYISFQDCVSIASQANLITDVEQVRNALLYYRMLGILLYYPEVPGLCDYVIVDHQWLFYRLANVMHLIFSQSPDLHSFQKFKNKGILSMELIKKLQWGKELKEMYFISLLVEMKIIAPIQIEDGSGKDYFIPYVLPTYHYQSQGVSILSQNGYLQGEPLLIQFVSNLIPRGFFCCLVVLLLQHLPNKWRHVLSQKDSPHAFINLFTFHLPGEYTLCLLDKVYYLEAQIRHHTSNLYQRLPVHHAVQDVLSSALEIVCEHLSYDSGKLQYGFNCHCRKTRNEHIAVPESISPPFDYALCYYNSTIVPLKPAHKVWLTGTECCYSSVQ